MQKLGLDLREIIKSKIEKVAFSLPSDAVGSMVECPECHYISKNNRFSAKVFNFQEGLAIKCFACGIWRRVNKA